MFQDNKILWSLFILSGSAIFLYIAGGRYGMNFTQDAFFLSFILCTPVLAVFAHIFRILGMRRGSVFIILAFVVGLAFEISGVTYGTFFGSSYTYHMGGPSLMGVPLAVPFYWAVFIYTGYSMTTSFLVWLDFTKPSAVRHDWRLLPLLIAFDGYFVTVIDLFMEPIMVKQSMWTWNGSGPYFDIPTDNFIGWFLVAVIVTGFYRTTEYFFFATDSNESRASGEQLGKMYSIPVWGYGLIYFLLLLSALDLGMYDLALIGSLLILPWLGLNALLFFRFLKAVDHIE